MDKQERRAHSKFTYENHEGRTGRVVTASVLSHGKRYVGAAKCSPDDEYDQSVGEKIAMLRALRKMHKADAKYYQYRIKRANEVIQDLSGILKHWERVLAKSAAGLESSKEACKSVDADLRKVLDSTKA